MTASANGQDGDNRRLSGKRRTENDEYALMVGRMIRAMGRRAGADINSLPELAALQAVVAEALSTATASLLVAGHSWTDIGDQLGMSRQGARQKFST